jgi:hypothetical protein
MEEDVGRLDQLPFAVPAFLEVLRQGQALAPALQELPNRVSRSDADQGERLKAESRLGKEREIGERELHAARDLERELRSSLRVREVELTDQPEVAHRTLQDGVAVNVEALAIGRKVDARSRRPEEDRGRDHDVAVAGASRHVVTDERVGR